MIAIFEICFLVQNPRLMSKTERPRELYYAWFGWGNSWFVTSFVILWAVDVSYLGDN